MTLPPRLELADWAGAVALWAKSRAAGALFGRVERSDQSNVRNGNVVSPALGSAACLAEVLWPVQGDGDRGIELRTILGKRLHPKPSVQKERHITAANQRALIQQELLGAGRFNALPIMALFPVPDALGNGLPRVRPLDLADRGPEVLVIARDGEESFVRIRHYGLCASSNVNTKLVTARRLLEPSTETSLPSKSESAEPPPWWPFLRADERLRRPPSVPPTEHSAQTLPPRTLRNPHRRAPCRRVSFNGQVAGMRFATPATCYELMINGAHGFAKLGAR